jgi:hypothetical protein
MYRLSKPKIFQSTSISLQTSPSFQHMGKSYLISIGNTEAFQTLSTSDLANCKRLGQTFFCEGCSVLQTNSVQECLISLYLGSATLIKTLQILYQQH